MTKKNTESIWTEIISSFTDGDDTYIDGYEPEDAVEEGKVIAIVHKYGIVEYKDKRAENDKYAQEMINEAISDTLTKLPVNTLDEMIQYFEEKHAELTSGDMDDEWGICHEIAKYLEFLETLRGLYWECAGCGRTCAPDEEYVENREDYYCMKCANEGNF